MWWYMKEAQLSPPTPCVKAVPFGGGGLCGSLRFAPPLYPGFSWRAQICPPCIEGVPWRMEVWRGLKPLSLVYVRWEVEGRVSMGGLRSTWGLKSVPPCV